MVRFENVRAERNLAAWAEHGHANGMAEHERAWAGSGKLRRAARAQVRARVSGSAQASGAGTRLADSRSLPPWGTRPGPMHVGKLGASCHVPAHPGTSSGRLQHAEVQESTECAGGPRGVVPPSATHKLSHLVSRVSHPVSYPSITSPHMQAHRCATSQPG